ncbi:MAG TPA: GNAT family N-acetyltransferase [Fimbriimonas sp.]
MPEIRPLQRKELRSFCELWNAVSPGIPTDLRELERDEATLPEPLKTTRWMAWTDGEPSGYAIVYRSAGSFHERKWMLHVGVAPESRAAGIGDALYRTALEAIESEGADDVSSLVREDDEASVRFAASRGFHEVGRSFESLFDLRACDPEKLQELVGSEVDALPFAAVDTPAFRRELHEAFEAVRHDIPRPDPPVRLSFEFFQEQILDDPGFLAEGTIVALADGKPVGFTGVFCGAQEGWVDTWLTGVLPGYRGRGIAKALKARSLLWSHRAGFHTVRTENSSENGAMLAINDRLGFVRRAAILTVRRSCGM